MALPIKHNHQVDTRKIYYDPEEVIESLAELAGFSAYKVLDEVNHIEGYLIEPDDEELRAFLACEDATEQHEAELVSAMASYMKEE